MNRSQLKSLAIFLSLLASSNAFGTAQEPINCNSFCDEILAWTEANDQYCANHGVQTADGVLADSNSGVTSRSGCDIQIAEGENCKEAHHKRKMCQYRNGQALQQCMAYRAAKDSDELDSFVLVLDVAATAGCGNACAMYMTGVGIAADAAWCQYPATIAGVGELLATLSQKSTTVSKVMGTLMPAAGVVAGNQSGVTTGDTKDTSNIVEGKDKPDGTKYSKEQNDKAGKSACVSAAAFAVMTAMRASNIDSMSKTKEEACKAVENLASNSATTGSGGSSGYASMPGYSSSSGSSSGYGSSSVASSSGTTSYDTNACYGSSPPSYCGAIRCGGTTMCATDANMLTRSGLDRAMAPLVSKINPNELKNKIKSEGVGAAIGAAMGGSGGDVGKGLAALAHETQNHNRELAGLVNLGTASSAYAGSGGGAKGGGGGDNPFANLGNMFAGGGGAAGPTGGTSLAAYGGASDIWHSKTDMNIFQIVSQKITTISGRVK